MYTGRARVVTYRAALVHRRTWLAVASGFFEPVLFLVALGFGLNGLINRIPGPDGAPIRYVEFVAPGLLASSTMNGVVYDAVFKIFHKLRHAKLYDSMITTPLGPVDIAVGEIVWVLLRGGLYAGGFLVVLAAAGLINSMWGLLVLPAALLISLAFGAFGMAVTTYLRSWHDFELIQLVVLPMFFFSGTFYPISVYPEWLQPVVESFPLYHGVELVRGLTTGHGTWAMLRHVVYLVAMTGIGGVVAVRRLRTLLLR